MINLKANNFYLKNIQGIIFDKDGTLTDSHIYWSKIISMRTELICERFSIDMEKYTQVSRFMGLNPITQKLLPKGPIALVTRREVIDKLIEDLRKIGIKSSVAEIEEIFVEVHKNFTAISDSFIKPIDECVDFIKKIHQRDVKISLLTSDTTHNAQEACKKLNIESYFEFIIGGDNKIGKKATGIPANYLCEKMQINKKNVIAIGDAPVDYEFSKKADLKGSILVATGQIPLCDLMKICKYSISNLSEVNID